MKTNAACVSMHAYLCMNTSKGSLARLVMLTSGLISGHHELPLVPYSFVEHIDCKMLVLTEGNGLEVWSTRGFRSLGD